MGTLKKNKTIIAREVVFVRGIGVKMTENNMDLAQLQQLLDADWLEEEYKEILKDTIRLIIKLMPTILGVMKKQFEEID